MTCSNPKNAWLGKDATGKQFLRFQHSPALEYIELPCRKCLSCRADQALVMSLRAYHEMKTAGQSCMLTLTYDDQHCPDQLNPEHTTKFLKRLRKKLEPLKIKYIYCGEYGGLTRRPHYHFIIFGTDFLGGGKTVLGHTIHPLISEAWPYGFHDIVPATLASIMYCCGYVTKKVGDSDTFKRQSNRSGGLGASFLAKYADDLARTGSVHIEGQTFQIPPFYFLKEPELLAHQKELKQSYAKTHPISETHRRAREVMQQQKVADTKIKETRR